MYRFIFGFQRRVWCPKWTPASKSCRMVTTAKVILPGRSGLASACPASHGRRVRGVAGLPEPDRKSTRLNSSHPSISYAVFCLKKKNHYHALRVRSIPPSLRTEPTRRVETDSRIDCAPRCDGYQGFQDIGKGQQLFLYSLR